MKININKICKNALADRKPGEDIDEALLRSCKKFYPDNVDIVFSAIGTAIELTRKKGGLTKKQAIEKLSTSKMNFNVSSKVTKHTPMSMKVSVNSGSIGNLLFGGAKTKTYRSLDEIPEDIRKDLPPEVKAHFTKSKSSKKVATSDARFKCSCGYASNAEFSKCPMCGKEEKKGFLAGIFGR